MEGNRYGDYSYKGSWKSNDPRLNKTVTRLPKESYLHGHQANGDFRMTHGNIHGAGSSAKTHTRKDYKLLIDPAIKKGHHKVYRYDGALDGEPPITPRDPRPPKSRLWTSCQAELPIPRFKVDKYYVGLIPETTVRFGCLNDNIDKRFLYELCSKFGDIEECKVYYDPKTKKHSGTGKCVFTRSNAARQAVSSLEGSSVMGNKIFVTLEKPKIADSRRSHCQQTHRRHSSSSSSSVSHDVSMLQQRDPRLLMFPTPSPSSASSIESTPPTPAIGWNNRHHPVASLQQEQSGSSGRRISVNARDFRALPTPPQASSAPVATSTGRSVEPVSPPAVLFAHQIEAAPLPPAPLPPSDKDEPPPPPPPPPNAPSRSSIEYEDISPSNNFDDTENNFSSQTKKKTTQISKEVVFTASIKRTPSQFCNRKSSDDNRSHTVKSRELKDQESTTLLPQATIVSSLTSNLGNVNKTINKDDKPVMYENIDSPDYKVKEFNALKTSSEPTYEAISDSDEHQENYEDISPVSSPQLITSTLSIPNAKPEEAHRSPLLTSVNQAPDSMLKNLKSSSAPDLKELVRPEEDDDNDDNMSLSSISSNEDTPLELNTPAASLQTSIPPPASATPSLPVPHLPFPTRINVPPPPIYPPIPPPAVPVRRPITALPPAPAPPPPPPPSVMPPYPNYPPNYPPPRFPSHQNIPPPCRGGMFYTSLYPQGIPPVPPNSSIPPPPPPYSSGFMPKGTSSPQKEHHKSQLPFKFRARESSSKAIDKDLKSVLSRDVMKRLVEQSGFKAFEAWWDNQEKSKSRGNTAKPPLNYPASNILSPLTPCKLESNDNMSSVSEGTNSLISDLFGILVKPGMGNSLSGFPKLPSFRIARKVATATPVIPSVDTVRKRTASGSSDSSLQKSRKLEASDDEDEDEEFDDIGLVSHIAKNKRDQTAFGQGHIRESVSVYDTVYSSGSDEESDSEREDTTLTKSTDDIQAKGEDEEDDEDDEEDDYGKDEEDEEDDEEEEEEEEEEDTRDIEDMEGEYSSYEEDLSSESDEEEEDLEDDEVVTKDLEEPLLEVKEIKSPDGDIEMVEGDDDKDAQPQEVTDVLEKKDGARDELNDISLSDKNEEEPKLYSEPSVDPAKPCSISERDEIHFSANDASLLDATIPPAIETPAGFQETEQKLSASEPLLNGQCNDIKHVSLRTDIKPAVKEVVEEEISLSLSGNEVASEEKLTVHYNDGENAQKPEDRNLWKNLFSEHSYSGGTESGEPKGDFLPEEVPEKPIYSATDQPVKQETQAIDPPINVMEPAFIDMDTEYSKVTVTDSNDYAIDKKDVFNEISKTSFDDMQSYVGTIHTYPHYNFPMRTIEEENNIVNDILVEGFDLEDVEYLKKAFESLQLMGSEVVENLNWCSHPETRCAPIKPKRTKNEPRHHLTGCARSEGYYKISDREKEDYLLSLQKQFMTKSIEEEFVDKDGTKHKSLSRNTRVMQRRLASSFVNEDFGDLVKFNQFKIRKKHLRFAKSNIHNWGLFACEPIAAEEMVIEYVGQIIRSIAADQREKRYEEIGIGSSYLFRMDAETVVDATKNGNLARFINHCCTPNCYAKIISVEGEKKIVIYSKRDIKVNEEITYDYKFPLEDEKIPCLCGTPQCRGTLN